MPETVFGLPIHPLVVHATVVVVPATATLLLLTLLLPRVRAWAGPLPLIMAVISTGLAPLSTSTGESLEHMVGSDKLIEEHAELADMLIWWCLAMLVVAAASYLLRRSRRELTKGLAVALVAAGLVATLGTLVQTALIGHSGAKAAWNGVATSAAQGSSSSGDGDSDGD